MSTATITARLARHMAEQDPTSFSSTLDCTWRDYTDMPLADINRRLQACRKRIEQQADTAAPNAAALAECASRIAEYRAAIKDGPEALEDAKRAAARGALSLNELAAVRVRAELAHDLLGAAVTQQRELAYTAADLERSAHNDMEAAAALETAKLFIAVRSKLPMAELAAFFEATGDAAVVLEPSAD